MNNRFNITLNSGFKASPNATAFAHITCISGPPCSPGKTAELIFLACCSLLVRTIPPLGPLSVLWVVDVTTSAYSNGFGYIPVATNPANEPYQPKVELTLSAIALNFLKSIILG